MLNVKKKVRGLLIVDRLKNNKIPMIINKKAIYSAKFAINLD